MTDTKKSASTTKSTTRKTTATKTAAKKAPAKARATKTAAKAAPKAAESQTVTIDGKEYALDALSENAQAQVRNLQATDRMIEELELELSIARTARSTYAGELERELEALNTTLQ